MENEALVHAESVTKGFQLVVDGNQVKLTVQNTPAGHSVSVTDVYTALLERRIPWKDGSLVEAVVAEADGLPHVIVPDLAAVGKDAEFILMITPDRMRAQASVRPAAWGKLLTVQGLQGELQKAGIRFGVVPGVLDEIVLRQNQEREWLVAHGQEPVAGVDAVIRYHFDLEKAKPEPTFLPDGRVDFRELDNIINVDPGQVLAERQPPVPGQPGWTVFQEELAPKPGREVSLPVGKGVKVTGNLILAEVAGQLVFRQNKLTVSPLHQVTGDVDYSTGNIRFVGNVQIRGSVKPGFLIEAEGDILISGWVDSASVICQGSLIVGGGIQGQGRGSIRAGGDITTRFIENCDVLAGGSIRVGEDIMHSTVSAGRGIEVGGRRGLIVGGSIRAADYVQCKVLGANLGTPTLIEVGTDPGMFEQYGRLQGEIARMEDEQGKLLLGIRRLLQLKEATGALPADRTAMLQRLQAAYQQRQQETVEKREQLAMQETALLAIREAYVKVTEVIYPGAKIMIGKSTRFTQERTSGCVFRLEGGELFCQQG